MKKADAIYILHENLNRVNSARQSVQAQIPVYDADSRNGIGSNVNVSVARNNVIRHAKAKGYKCIWMLDDSIRLAETIKVLQSDGLKTDVVKMFVPKEYFICNLDELQFSDTTVVGNLPLYNKTGIFRDNDRFNRFVYCAYFIDVTKTLMFDEKIWYGEDVDFSIRTTNKFGPIETNYNVCLKTLDRNTVEYESKSGTICSSNFAAKCKAYYDIYVKHWSQCTIRYHNILGYYQVLPARIGASQDLHKYIDISTYEDFIKSCDIARSKGKIEVVR